MSLPTSQQRILVKIEGRLRDSDPQLSSRFVIFGRLTRDETMPWLEQIKPRPIADRLLPVVTVARRVSRRPAARVRALLLLPAALTAMLCAIAITVGFPGAHRGTPVKAHIARELVVKGRICRIGLIRGPALAC
jgi:hypothetical protein